MDDGPGEPTEVAAEPTELAGIAEADTQSAYAWGLDDGEEWEPPRRVTPRLITTAAVTASVLAIAGAGITAYIYLRDRSPEPASVATPVTNAAVSPTPAAALPAPPPVTITTVIVQAPPPPVTVAPPTAAPTVSMADRDDRFIETMSAYGWRVSSPMMFAQHGRNVCAALRQGSDRAGAARIVQSNLGVPLTDAEVFVRTATEIYPSCP